LSRKGKRKIRKIARRAARGWETLVGAGRGSAVALLLPLGGAVRMVGDQTAR
jgi:hypothetical protein